MPGATPASQLAHDARPSLPAVAPQPVAPQATPLQRAALSAAPANVDDDVIEFATRINKDIPVDVQYTGSRPTVPLTLDDYDAREKSWTERAAISAASIGQNAPRMRAGDDTLKQAQTVRLDARKGEVPSPEAVNRAYIRSLGSGYESIYDDYWSKTGRSLLALDETPAELVKRARYVMDANSPTGGYYEASIATTERTVGLLNAYAQGGIEGARNFAAKSAPQESQPEAAPSTAEASPTLDAARRGFAEGSIGTAQLVQNIELLGRGLKAELTGGVQGEDYKSLQEEAARRQATFDTAARSLPEERGFVARITRGVVSGGIQIPQLFAMGPYGAMTMVYLQHAHKGDFEATKEAVKMLPGYAAGNALGAISQGLNPVTGNILQRTGAGVVGVATDAAGGERDASKLAASFVQNAAMPVGKSGQTRGDGTPLSTATQVRGNRDASFEGTYRPEARTEDANNQTIGEDGRIYRDGQATEMVMRGGMMTREPATGEANSSPVQPAAPARTTVESASPGISQREFHQQGLEKFAQAQQMTPEQSAQFVREVHSFYAQNNIPLLRHPDGKSWSAKEFNDYIQAGHKDLEIYDPRVLEIADRITGAADDSRALPDNAFGLDGRISIPAETEVRLETSSPTSTPATIPVERQNIHAEVAPTPENVETQAYPNAFVEAGGAELNARVQAERSVPTPQVSADNFTAQTTALLTSEAEGVGDVSGIEAIARQAERRDNEIRLSPVDYEPNMHFVENLPQSSDVRKQYDVHSLIRGSYADRLNQLDALLVKGIDKSRSFDTVNLDDNGVSQNGGSGFMAGSPLVLISEPGKMLKESPVRTVIVNETMYDGIPELQKRYPDVRFVRGDQAGDFLTINATQAGAQTVRAGKTATPPQVAADRKLTRNFRAGNNDASLTFASLVQRDLYDFAANSAGSRQSGRNPRAQAASLPEIERRLQATLGIPRDELIRRALAVRDDVRAQMKGVKDGETRVVTDNVRDKNVDKTTSVAVTDAVTDEAQISSMDKSEEKPTKHDYSSTQVNLPQDVKEKVLRASRRIKTEDLASDGREDKPHITVRYGLQTNTSDEVRKALANVEPFTVRLGKTSIFPAKEGADYDVVKVDVESPELRAVNKLIADALPHTDTHPTYQPHVTLAYVKAGAGRKYANKPILEGTEMRFDSIAFSDKNGEMVAIPLGGQDAKVNARAERERSFPRTLEANNFKGGTDRTYTPTTNRESVETARKVISERGVDGAFDYVINEERPSAAHTATGIALMNRLQNEGDALKATRPEESVAKYARAAELAGALSSRLTEAGQVVQAASIVARLLPDGILIYAQRQIAKHNPEAKVTAEQAQALTVAAKRMTVADAGNEQSIRIAELAEKAKAEGMLTAEERTEIRDYIKTLQGAAGATPRQTVTQIVTVRLDAIEQAAQARLKARGYQLNVGIPADVIADYSALYAARLAKGAVKAVDWAAQVAKDYGVDVRPILARVERESLRLLNTERARARAIYKDARTMEATLGKIEEVKRVDAEQARTLSDLAASLKTLTGDAKIEAAQELQGALQTLDRPSVLRKISTAQTIAQLLNPKTITRNVVGNELFYRLERINKYPATAIDFTRSKLTGTERQITFRKEGQGDYWRNFLRGARAGARGVNPMGIESQYDFKGTAFKSRYNPAFYLERGLKASIQGFDFAAYMRARNQTLAELGVLKARREGIPSSERRAFVKSFMEDADAASIEVAHEYGKYTTFQDDNLLSQSLGGFKKGLNKLSTLGYGDEFGLGDLVLKYPRTPGALIMRGLEYTPAGVLRSIYHLKPFMSNDKTPNIREAQLALSRAITGQLGITSLGLVLAEAGVLTGNDNDDDRDQTAYMKDQTGVRGHQVNGSAIRRWMTGDFSRESLKRQQGDTLMSYDWAQPIALNIAIAADIHKNIKSGKAATTGVFGTAVDSLAAGINTVVEQPLFQGVQSLFGSTYGDDKLAGLKKVLEGVPASFVPTFLNQIKQVTDNQARETYDPNPLRRALNRGIAKLPFVASRLPEAYTTLGAPKQTYRSGTNSLFNVFLNPAFVEKYEVNPEVEMVLRPFAQEDRKEQFPRRAPRKLKFDGKEYGLSGAELQEMQRAMGTRTAREFAALDAVEMRSLSPEDQEKKMAAIVSDAFETTKRDYLELRGVDIYVQFRREQAEKGLKPPQVDHNLSVHKQTEAWKERLKANPTVRKLPDEAREGLMRAASNYFGAAMFEPDVSIRPEAMQRSLNLAKRDAEKFFDLKVEQIKAQVEAEKRAEQHRQRVASGM
ncbi:MAG: 2'-5' RNA ligase family protein [Pyrinomonadaceae bacterium MAG19_C2-C3]|nr:2'-5' RNA ligase family protein [Pyrinomonadaceae bacterium MAG19_C2-C3]